MNNFDMNKMAEMLGKMDKAELENGINQLSKMMNSKDGTAIKNMMAQATGNINGGANTHTNGGRQTGGGGRRH